MDSKVLVIAEQDSGKLGSSTLSTINCALQISANVEILLAAANDKLVKEVAALKGITHVHVITHPCFEHILAEDLTPIVVELAKKYTHVLAPSTTFGKNILPRVAALLDVAQVSDVCQIIDSQTFVRPIYAGNAFETIQSLDNFKVLTVRTTAFDAIQKGESQAPVTILDFKVQPSSLIEFVESQTPELSRPELTSAKIIISGGRGLKSADNFKMIELLADKLGAAVGASRAAVDAGFVPNDLQVGQTGKIVAPTLYIAIGISGAIQHLAGMKDSKIIVAINKDSDAPIFQIADYGLVGDLFQIVPELIASLN